MLWDTWYAKQREHADRYLVKQARAGKTFVLEDIRLESAEEGTEDEGERPSAIEFMANITLRVSTHLDQGAEAKGRPRKPPLPDLKCFVCGAGRSASRTG